MESSPAHWRLQHRSELSLVRGNLGTGKPGGGEGHRTGRGRAEALCKEGHPKVGAARKRGGRMAEKMILVTWQFLQRSCWCGKILCFWIKIHLVWKATHLSLPEPCPFPPRIQIWEPGICPATSLCFYLICFLFPLGGRERRINMAEKINTG